MLSVPRNVREMRCTPKFFRLRHLSLGRSQSSGRSGRGRLVVLGTGWGSYSLLRSLSRGAFERVTVISPRNHFLFTPLLASTSTGTLEFRSIVEFVRDSIHSQGAEFHLSRAEGIDVATRRVHCASEVDGIEYEEPYDMLVVGVGARANSFGIPGVDEHAHFLKEIKDAQSIRRHIIDNFEAAAQPGHDEALVKRLLHFVVVGGGPTGVEFSAELHDFVKQDLSRFFPDLAQHVKVSIVEILSLFDESLREFAVRKIESRPRMEILHKRVARVERDRVEFDDGTAIESGLTLWSAGVGPQPIIGQLDWPRSKQHRLLVDDHLRALGDPSGRVFALGDCAHILGAPLPATAQVAERQGKYLALMLPALARAGMLQSTPSSTAPGDSTPAPRVDDSLVDEAQARAVESLPTLDGLNVAPFSFASKGMLAYIGDYHALATIGQTRIKGVASWVLWRSAYLTRLGSWRARLQVPFDWLKAMLLGRDISRF